MSDWRVRGREIGWSPFIIALLFYAYRAGGGSFCIALRRIAGWLRRDSRLGECD